MQMVKIRFPDDKNRTEGFYALIQQVRVVCLPNDEFVIPEARLSILDERAIRYTALERGGFDYALKALRDSTAAAL